MQNNHYVNPSQIYFDNSSKTHIHEISAQSFDSFLNIKLKYDVRWCTQILRIFNIIND